MKEIIAMRGVTYFSSVKTSPNLGFHRGAFIRKCNATMGLQPSTPNNELCGNAPKKKRLQTRGGKIDDGDNDNEEDALKEKH